jgi:imidazoleglycerol-phosphate dehydratase/histidinol-phosphatase
MLDQIARHGNMDLMVKVNGDLTVDEHHTIEDTGIVLGEAIIKALGRRKGLKDMVSCFLWMIAWLRQQLISGRSWLVWEAEFKREKLAMFLQRCSFTFSNRLRMLQNPI